MGEIVLVHGAWHGGWCWDAVADGLSERGHTVHIVTLPGHDRPGTSTRIWNRVSHYLDEIDRVVRGCAEPPVIVGHSMGGYLTQRYLENHIAAAGVLVASVPHRGALAANLRILRRMPGATLAAMGLFDYHRLVDTEAKVREFFFAADTPSPVVAETAAKLQSESALAILTMLARPPRPTKVTSPVHVISAEGDVIFPVAEQEALAAAYGADQTVIAGAHDLMLEPTWSELVDTIHRIVDEP